MNYWGTGEADIFVSYAERNFELAPQALIEVAVQFGILICRAALNIFPAAANGEQSQMFAMTTGLLVNRASMQS